MRSVSAGRDARASRLCRSGGRCHLFAFGAVSVCVHRVRVYLPSPRNLTCWRYFRRNRRRSRRRRGVRTSAAPEDPSKRQARVRPSAYASRRSHINQSAAFGKQTAVARFSAGRLGGRALGYIRGTFTGQPEITGHQKNGHVRHRHELARPAHHARRGAAAGDGGVHQEVAGGERRARCALVTSGFVASRVRTRRRDNTRYGVSTHRAIRAGAGFGVVSIRTRNRRRFIPGDASDPSPRPFQGIHVPQPGHGVRSAGTALGVSQIQTHCFTEAGDCLYIHRPIND